MSSGVARDNACRPSLARTPDPFPPGLHCPTLAPLDVRVHGRVAAAESLELDLRKAGATVLSAAPRPGLLPVVARRGPFCDGRATTKRSVQDTHPARQAGAADCDTQATASARVAGAAHPAFEKPRWRGKREARAGVPFVLVGVYWRATEGPLAANLRNAGRVGSAEAARGDGLGPPSHFGEAAFSREVSAFGARPSGLAPQIENSPAHFSHDTALAGGMDRAPERAQTRAGWNRWSLLRSGLGVTAVRLEPEATERALPRGVTMPFYQSVDRCARIFCAQFRPEFSAPAAIFGGRA